MIHYHGTPITKRDPHLEKLRGRHFCVSYAQPQDARWCIEHAQSVMWDNGAFSTFTKGKPLDKAGYINWLDDKLYGANWAIIPDIIGGTVEDQREYMSGWPYPRHLSSAVWHMNLSLEWLRELVQEYPRVCFGSSGLYWKVLSKEWSDRADAAWEVIERVGNRNTIHMLRGLKVCGKRWPFASADSTNIARNHGSHPVKKCTKEMAERIDAIQCPMKLIKA
ncbi:hypothetical protein UFOVP59_21 [uncultured Caudovirales phage]|uniref:Uncharacterized protein n=1 Tax=uncultured Caudovirales phage TaxID=2100421 RepID=A0A6J5KX13_9CAUD|nr:hypothetical protein UFOVP59_21 [uncultured Caudovirales phage]CAB5220590.1 hypothetical protein UFOVP246_11 [uncultured Caudovirales phage]